MINATGLWLNKTKEGETFMAGNMGGVRVLVFKNKKKQEGSAAPDYNLVFAENKKEGEKKTEEERDVIPF